MNMMMAVLSKTHESVKVLDLCCGMGGLSYGFAKMGFEVTGLDINGGAGATYLYNKIGRFSKKDITKSHIKGYYEVIVGGPPCEPWSCLNLTRRKEEHPNYRCISAFFAKVRLKKPTVFVMENVPAIRKDVLFINNLNSMRRKYETAITIVKYSDYGAAFGRKRLFLVGIKKEEKIAPSEIFGLLKNEKPKTVRDVIDDLKDKKPDPTTDHIWPAVRTIYKYAKYYKSGKYGWYILDWDKTSPSFGNVTKTYILHPDSFINNNGGRPISVREALRIVGFPDHYRFPYGLGIRAKYEMIADAVSPVFSLKLAEAIKNIFFA
jgi:DNA (cytosine-5)-methyltransferase 1